MMMYIPQALLSAEARRPLRAQRLLSYSQKRLDNFHLVTGNAIYQVW